MLASLLRSMRGFRRGRAPVICNASGRASGDAIRSFVTSHKLLGTREWFVTHYTDCAMEMFRMSDRRCPGPITSIRQALMTPHGPAPGKAALAFTAEF